MDDPWTSRIVPMVFAGSRAYFSNRNNFTPPSLVVQCSSLFTAAVGLIISFITHLYWTGHVSSASVDGRNMIGLDDVRPFGDLSIHKHLEIGLRHCDRSRTRLFPGFLDIGPRCDLSDLLMEPVHDRLRRARRRHEADPESRVETRDARFSDRRHVGQDRRPGRSGRSEGANEASL